MEKQNTIPTKYLLKRAVLGKEPEIELSEKEYSETKRCRESIYDAFEIELAFELTLRNYIAIEKFIAEHLILDTVQKLGVNDFRNQQWEFIRVFSNWLASVSSWQDIKRKRIVGIFGRNSELDSFQALHDQLMNDETFYALIDHLRNYSQHSGFPLSGFSSGGSWNEEGTELIFSSKYNFNYDHFKHYFEAEGPRSKTRRKFGQKLQQEAGSNSIDLKLVIRKYVTLTGKLMDDTREVMTAQITKDEDFILEMIKRYETNFPEVRSVASLSVFPVDNQGILVSKDLLIPVRDEFITHARALRKTNNALALAVEKRVTTSA